MVIDTNSGSIIGSFEFRTANNFQFTVLAEDQVNVDSLKQAFEKASAMSPVKRSMAKTIGNQIHTVSTMPWKIPNGVIYSLEKVIIAF